MLLSAGLGGSGGSGRGTRDFPRPGTQRFADDCRRLRIAEDRAPGGLKEAVEPGEASEGSVQNASGPRRQVAGTLEARDASGEVGGRAGEQRGPGGFLLAQRPREREDHGAVAGDLLSGERIATGVDGFDQQDRVIARAERHGDGELSVGERQRLRERSAGAGVRDAEPHGLSRGSLAADQHPTADKPQFVAHGSSPRYDRKHLEGSIITQSPAVRGRTIANPVDSIVIRIPDLVVACSSHDPWRASSFFWIMEKRVPLRRRLTELIPKN